MSERTIFLAALEKDDPAGRAAYLDTACAGDPDLRRRVESLLQAHADAASFLNEPAPAQLAAGAHPARDDTDATEAEEKPEGDDAALAFLQASTKPDSLGRLGHYEVQEVLGRGGFGIVLKAFDQKLHRVVAIKVLGPQLAGSGTARKRFLREAQAAAAVRNEHVVDIHAVDDSPLPHLVMEYVAGLTLQERIDRAGPLELQEVLRIGSQIARGLAAAHEQGLIHRDIKPANILLENGVERVKITDFGLARAADDASLTQSGMVAGTPQYMAPEQAAGEALDHRADLFSLGSTLYVMCTGRPPFRASGTLAVLKRVIEDEPRPIRESNSEVPAWLCAVIARLHAKKPADRFQSAREVADLLAKYLAELQIHGGVVPTRSAGACSPDGAATADPVRIGRGGARRNRRRLVPALALVALLVLLGGWGIHRLTRPTPGVDSREPDPPLAVAPFDEEQARQHQAAWAQHLGVPVEVTNTVGMKLRLVPPGDFLMGSSDQVIGELRAVQNDLWSHTATSFEGPQQKVSLPEPFFMGACEVTVGQFQTFVRAEKYRTQAEVDGKGGYHWVGHKLEPRPEWTWRTPPYPQTDDHPVVFVSWVDARAFCDWLSRRERRQYVLPSEVQWEFACRAGNDGKWSCGDDESRVAEHAWTAQPGTRAVAGKQPNGFGLYDLHGNVCEWCADPWVDHRADSSGQNQGSEALRPLRGGSFGAASFFARSASRHNCAADVGNSGVGFRVALVGDLQSPPWPPAPPRTEATVWRDHVAGLPAAEQVRQVTARLVKLNPGFAGPVTPTIEADVVTGLRLNTDAVADLSPVAALTGLQVLSCAGTSESKGKDRGLSDLSPLQDLRLKGLVIRDTAVRDLSPLADMPLKTLDCTWLDSLSDLSPLRGTPLEELTIDGTGVRDLSPLRGMGLRVLRCSRARVWEPDAIDQNLDVLRTLKKLETMDGRSGADVRQWADRLQDEWKAHSAGLLAGTADDAFVKAVAGLQPENQVRAVAGLLQKLNKGFDGKVVSEWEGGVVTKLEVPADEISDLSPVRALTGLKSFACVVPDGRRGKLADLSPLRGLRLTHLYCFRTRVSDLTPLRDMPLQELQCFSTPVRDLSPLRGMPLRSLNANGTQISDLSPLQGMKLQWLTCWSVHSPDPSPLRDMPLKSLDLDFKPERDTVVLRSFKTLETICWKPAAEFWKDVDAKIVEAADCLVRGRQLAGDGKWAEAEGEFKKAVAVNPNDPHVWRWRGQIHAELGRLDQAAADFNKALDLVAPEKGGWFGDRDGIDDELARWPDVFDRIPPLRPNDGILWIARARQFGQRGQWQQAAEACAHAVHRRPGEDFGYFAHAICLLQAGDAEGHVTVCREMLARFGGTEDALQAAVTAKTCLVGPGALPEKDRVLELADIGFQKWDRKSIRFAQLLCDRGLADVRAGKGAGALERVKQALPLKKDKPDVEVQLYLVAALAHHRLGQVVEGRQALAAARRLLAERMPRIDRGESLGASWYDWAVCQVLLREAEALIEKGTGAPKE